MKKPELLAPAGDFDCLVAAVSAGADAVYFGTDILNARIRAKNFTVEDADKAVFFCHAHGVKVYVTVNVAVYEREFDEVFSYVDSLYKSGADALIVSDFGVISALKNRYPDFEIHASTQCTVHNSDGADFLYSLGCKRIVVARELDRENIEKVCLGKADIEMFVHGAHCMSVSGQCLMSFAMGGRSGNRGECAQPCRLPYRICGKDGYYLSLKDMSLSQHVPEILSTGVSSLKIEGRMKNPDYVYTTVSVWRKLIDGERNATFAELSTLAGAFSRQGFTDDYFIKKTDGNMLGVRTDKDKEKTKDTKVTVPGVQRIKISVLAKLRVGKCAEITLSDGKNTVTCVGDIVEEAKNAPMSDDDIKRNLIKFGSTPYEVLSFSLIKDENVMIRISSLNALRRNAARALSEKAVNLVRSYNAPTATTSSSISKPKIIKTALFSNPDSIPENNPFDIVFVYLERYKKGVSANGICLPPVIFDSEWKQVEKMLREAKKDGIKYALISNVGQIKRVRNMGFSMIADFRFNIFNPACVEVLQKEGFENMVISPELSLAQINPMQGCLVTVYGKFPTMTTHKCIIKDTAGCDKCKAYLCDRTGASFYADGVFGHRNIIYNSVPVYMADKINLIENFSHHFIFTDESKLKCEKIIKAYEQGLATDAKIRRIK